MARFRFAGVYLAKKEDKLVGVPYADISIYLAGTDTPAVVYTSETGSYYVSSTPQLSTNENGEFEFYVDDTDYDYTQKFKIICSKPGYETKIWDYVTIFPYSGFDAHSIRGVNVASLEMIAAHDLLKYQGTQFVPENINEVLKSYLNPSSHDLPKYQGTQFVPENINEILKSYFNPNTDDILHYNGTQFVSVGFQSLSSSIQKISEVEVDSTVDYVDFTNLDGNNDWFYVLLFSIKCPLTSDQELQIFFNGDNNQSNYYRQGLGVDGASVSAGRDNTSGIATLRPNKSTQGRVDICRGDDGYIVALAYTNNNVGSGVRIELKITSTAGTKSNLTSIRITTPSSGAIGSGSKFLLFRARRA